MRLFPSYLVAVLTCACAAATADGGDPRHSRSLEVSSAPTLPAVIEAAREPTPEPAALALAGPTLPEVRPAPRGLPPTEVRRLLAEDSAALGSLSIGRPNRGALWNAVTFPEGPLWHIVDPRRAHGTAEAVRSIMMAISRVEIEHPGSPRLHVGHLSSERGGYLRPHRSHQSGRDVDLGFYYRGGERWYARATPENLDQVRTWSLIRALIEDPNVETVFVDWSVQRMLRKHAEATGVDPAWLSAHFQERRREQKTVRHEWGHLTHLHVRFRSEEAQAAGALAHRELLANRQIPPRRYY